MMWRVQFSGYGAPQEVIELVQVAPPEPPGVGQVMVRVQAFPINPSDLLTPMGRYAGRQQPPAGLGAEAVGVVEAVGPNVTRVAPGDRVIFLCRDNWVEYRCVPEAQLAKVSAEADLCQVAMLKVNPATASLLLSQFVKLEAGDLVIQNAAGSAVGRYVAQFARARGIDLLSVVRRPMPSLGPSETILVDGPDLAQRVQEATAGRQRLLALDAVGGETTMRLADCVSVGGTVVVYGGLDGGACALRPDQAIFHDIRLRGFWLTRHVETAPRSHLDRLYGELAGMVVSGTLSARIAAQYSIGDIRSAVAHAAQSRGDGKVLVVA